MAMNKQRKTGNILNIVSYDTSGNVTLPAAIAAGTLHDAAYTRFVKPNGGTYVPAASSATGAIAVTLPVGKSNSMLRVTIKVYEYTTNRSFEIHAGGYDYDSGGTHTWVNNPYAYIIGNPGVDRRFNVRFGYNASTNKAIIYIGELNTVWSYPQVWVTEIQVGFGGMNSSWLNACSVAFEASAFQNVTATITNAQVGYAVSTNTANSVVLRDGSGNFSAGTITATALSASGTVTAANFSDSSGSYNVNLGSAGNEGRGVVAGYSGSAYSGIGYNVRHTTTAAEYIAPGSDTSSYLLFTGGGFVFYGAPAGTPGRTLAYTTLGSFSAAGIFNALNVTVGGNQSLHAANYNSYAPTLTGTGASGTWAINITGNAATATNLSTNRSNWVSNGTITAVVGQLAWRHYGNNHTIFDASNSLSPDGTTVNNTNPTTNWTATYPTLMGWNGTQTYGVRVDSARLADNSSAVQGLTVSQLFNNMGDSHSTRSSFDLSSPSYGFGFRFIQGSTNGPGTGGSQYYSLYIGLGNDYPATGATSYGLMLAVDRNVTTPYLSVRYNESNVLSTWRKISAGYADNAGTLGGLALQSASTAPSANQVLRSDPSGYSFFGYINSNTGNSENPTVSQVIVTAGTDNYYRKASIAHLTSAVQSNASGTWSINITGNANNITQYTINQNLGTANSPTFQEVYANGWFRNNTVQTGLYNTVTTQHWSSKDNGYWDASSTNTVSSIRFFTGGLYSALRGYVFANSSNELGFLDAAGTWILRTVGTANTYLTGAFTVSSTVTATAFFESSDIRLKTVLETNPDKTIDVDVIKFERKDATGVRYGYSAQDVQKIAPELVAGDDFLSVNYLDLHTLKIAALEKEIRELKAKLGN